MLNDPKNLAPTKLPKLKEKLSGAKLFLARSTDKGGWPFVYSFIATKQHYLLDTLKKGDKSTSDEKDDSFTTAATDGRKYYWCPEFLEKLTQDELIVVFAHETYHIIMQHCNGIRTFGKYPGIWNLAIDYVVNSCIEYDMRINKGNKNNFTTECEAAYKTKSKHPIWNGNFNEPLVLSELIASILEFKDLSEEEKIEKRRLKKEENKKVVFADFEQYKRSPESIYDEIMNALKSAGESPGDLNDLIGQYAAMDDHIDSTVDKKTIFEELLNAATSTRKMYGTIPGCIEDVLKELENPKLKWEDICRQSIQTVRREVGAKNDWARFRRRNLSLGIYSPKKRDQFIRWLCLLDTSGSMSLDDISYGVSQLKVLDSRSEGIVVPVDASPHWEKATKIRSMSDLPKINLVGRGGTVFDDFFNDYQSKIKEQIDLIIVISDGGFSLNCKRPPVDTVFVITNEHMPTVPFGRVAPLRTFT